MNNNVLSSYLTKQNIIYYYMKKNKLFLMTYNKDFKLITILKNP